MLYRSDKRNSLHVTCLYLAVVAASSTPIQSLPLKVLDFGLQMLTGPRQIEETGFAFIHVIIILYSADIWHEVMLFFTLWFVLQLWIVPTLKSQSQKLFSRITKK